MRTPRPGELGRVGARRAGAGPRGARAGKPGRDERARGSAGAPGPGGQGPRRGRGEEGRGGKRGAGPIRAQLQVAAGLLRCPRSRSNGGEVVFPPDWTLFREL